MRMRDVDPGVLAVPLRDPGMVGIVHWADWVRRDEANDSSKGRVN